MGDPYFVNGIFVQITTSDHILLTDQQQQQKHLQSEDELKQLPIFDKK